jgi:hypothetical protein
VATFQSIVFYGDKTLENCIASSQLGNEDRMIKTVFSNTKEFVCLMFETNKKTSHWPFIFCPKIDRKNYFQEKNAVLPKIGKNNRTDSITLTPKPIFNTTPRDKIRQTGVKLVPRG